MIQLVSPLPERAGLFTFERPVMEHEPSFASKVLDIQDTASLMLTLNRLEPHIVSAPTAQGKGTLLYAIRNALTKKDWSHFRDRWIDPSKEDFQSCERIVTFLALALGGNPRSNTFHELLSSSTVLQDNSRQGLTTLLLIRTSSCVERSVLGWFVHSVFQLGSELREIGEHLRVRVLMTGNRDLAGLTVGPSSLYPFPQVTLRNFNFSETKELIHRVSEAAEKLGGMVFEPDAIELIFSATHGDKYFVNLLAAHSAAVAEQRFQDRRVLIGSREVEMTIERIRDGQLERRILPKLKALLQSYPEAIEELVEHHDAEGAGWGSIQRESRELLFEAGLVGPVDLDDSTGRSGTEHRYKIRNPIIEELLKTAVSEDAGRSFIFIDSSAGIPVTLEEQEISNLYMKLSELRIRRELNPEDSSALAEFEANFKRLRQLQEAEADRLERTFDERLHISLSGQDHVLREIDKFRRAYEHENIARNHNSSDNGDDP